MGTVKRKTISKEGKLKANDNDNGNVKRLSPKQIERRLQQLKNKPQTFEQMKEIRRLKQTLESRKILARIEKREKEDADRAAQRTKIPAVATLLRGFEQELHAFNDAVFRNDRDEYGNEVNHAIEPTKLYDFIMKYDPFRRALLHAKFPQLVYKSFHGVPAANALLMLMVDKNLLVYRNARYLKTVYCVKCIGSLFDAAAMDTVASSDVLRQRALKADRTWPYTEETLEEYFIELSGNGFSARENLQTLAKLHDKAKRLNIDQAQINSIMEETKIYRKEAREGDQQMEDAEYKQQATTTKKDTSAIDEGFVQRPAKPLKARKSAFFVQNEIEHENDKMQETKNEVRKKALIRFWKTEWETYPKDVESWDLGQLEEGVGSQYDEYMNDKGKKKPKVKYSGKEALADEKYVPTAAELKKARAKATYDDDENPFGQMKA